MSGFKIAAAQVASIRGDVARNIETHAAAIMTAAVHGVSVLIFPELSLIGYEPDLAADLAITPDDARLNPLAALAGRHQMSIVVGASLRNGRALPGLGAILFNADGTTRTYHKMHLGGREPTYFAPGSAPLMFDMHGQTIGLAICADASEQSHPQGYVMSGSSIYAAGVFLNAEWYRTDAPRLAAYAAAFQMVVVMANHATSVGTYTSVGRSAAWSPDGTLLAEAAGPESCLVIATRHRRKWSGEVVLC
ncbi:MAG: carbon-nitrogen hydrolase family protein [Planctomycetaceae bacterium]|nr:carbon-nitrogen hydrolase family protein [Planctomycetaceae bacterium]